MIQLPLFLVTVHGVLVAEYPKMGTFSGIGVDMSNEVPQSSQPEPDDELLLEEGVASMMFENSGSLPGTVWLVLDEKGFASIRFKFDHGRTGWVCTKRKQIKKYKIETALSYLAWMRHESVIVEFEVFGAKLRERALETTDENLRQTRLRLSPPK